MLTSLPHSASSAIWTGLPVAGGTYKFTLLDAQGQPIACATPTGTWLACTVDAPRNSSVSVTQGVGIDVAWDPVASAPGFDPTATPPLGFFQIELGPDDEEGSGGYGASGIHLPSHLIPYVNFGGYADGLPDGHGFGNALAELDDGVYGFDVTAFAEAPPDSVAQGLECQIRAADERTQFDKTGSQITILIEP